jgi:hypothetical protein
MANALQVKADVINELKNRLYYNQLEIGRLVNSPGEVSHKTVVDITINLLRENVLSIESINLMESYIQPPTSQESENVPQIDEESIGVKKIY